MNLTKKIKRKLLKRKEELMRFLEYYEILENMIKNDDDGKTPKMLSFRKTELIDWIKENNGKKQRVKEEYQMIQEELNQLEEII